MNDTDRRIAIEIMGWELKPHKWADGSYTDFWGDKNTSYHSDRWRPATDIAQAFQVVAKMRELGWDFFMEWETDEKCLVMMQYIPPDITLDRLPIEDKFTKAEANTPAAAIAQAALKAIDETI